MARADETGEWMYDRQSEQLPRRGRDLMAHTTALGTADAAKWVNRQEHCLTQPRATISEYFGRSVRETGRGSSRAVSGAPPGTIRNSGG